MTSTMEPFGAMHAYEAPLGARLAFLRKTYLHLTGAVLAFMALSAVLLNTPLGASILNWIGGGRASWLLVLGGFMLVGWFARSMARSVRSPAVQYLGLGAYVVAWSIMFAPLLAIASRPEYSGTIPTAAALTVLAFGGLSAFVLTTKKDFSFLGPILTVAGLVALGLIVVSVFVPGLNLGIWFSAAMVLFACGAILYDTSKVLHEYRTDQHVAASLELFASVALLFWYVLRIVMQMQRR